MPNRARIFTQDMALMKRFLDGLSQIRGIRVPGGFESQGKVAVVSVLFEKVDNAAAGHALEAGHGIMTRCGLHCSPAAHKALQTYPAGAVRFSFGWANTEEDVDQTLRAVEEIART